MSTDPQNHESPTVAAPRRRFYALTDNGDWMEMLSHSGGPLDGYGVSFMAIEIDDAGFYANAEEGAGILLGRVTIVDGVPVLFPASDFRDVAIRG